MKKPRSQIAVIITFVIAAIILFIVVFINIARVSQVKTTTSQAVDRTALSLASQIGSMSHYYAHTVLENKVLSDGTPGECSDIWKGLAIIIVGVIIGLVFVPTGILLPIAMVGAGVSLISTTMVGEISDQFNKMSNFNALRESALLQAATSLQSDDVILLPKPAEPGFFYEDVNNNGTFDAGDAKYNLSAIPQMHKQNKVDRFSAWYYTKRLPWVSDDGLKTELDIFISRLKDFVDVDEWDSTKWNIKKASYTIEPAASASASPKYRTTCTTDCPAWVDGLAWPEDPESRRIRIVTIDRDDKDSNNNYNPTGGFLKDKFISLAERIEGVYDLTFCSSICLFGWCPYTNCGDINNIIVDLTMFLGRTKELFDLPISARLTNVREWFPLFYDFNKHDQVDIDADGDLREPKDPGDPQRFDYDIYLRLTHVEETIKTWIIELESKDAAIRDTIDDANGHNEYGLGDTVSECATVSCCGHDCQTPCCYPASCSFEGIFCSACGSSTPPVCVNGDLYGKIPSGCPLGNRSASCACSCSRNPQCPNACNFQGQFVRDTMGPTEVGQAIGILEALNDDIARIKMTIAQFADKVEQLLPKESPLKNKITYAWKDAWKGEGKAQFSHLVHVKIEGKDANGNITGYPNMDLPHIIEKRSWGGIEKCYILEAHKGSFQISTFRYDQDQPTPIGWKLQRRKPTAAEFDTAKLDAIVADIQDNGTINTTQADVDTLLSNCAIASTSQVSYGPEKSDIYIMKTEGD